MTDNSNVDLGPFLRRHDRVTRRTFIVMLVTSLALSLAIYLRFRVNAALLPEVPTWPPFMVQSVVISPFSIIALWLAGKWYGRTRPPAQPDGSFPMTADDARNVRRVANAGAVFVTGYGLVMIAIQVFWALRMYGILSPTSFDATLGFRLVMLAVAALMIYFGNLGPRMPVARAPEAKPTVRMRYNRLSSWMTVIFGALLAVAALFAPGEKLADSVGGLSILLVIVMAVGAVMYFRELKSAPKPSES